jgi:glycosyltransferase involved in cell wall biosynthesis
MAPCAPKIADYASASASHLRQTGGRRIPRSTLGPELPLVSVVTIVRNCRPTLAQTIRCVLAQSYPNIEYIIVDGASTDGTLEIIKEFNSQIDLWISEPDLNSSDAMNKAISLTRGEFVSWVLADDWVGTDFIEVAVEALLSSGADFVFGDLKVYEGDSVLSLRKGDGDYPVSRNDINAGHLGSLQYPSMVTRRARFEQLGLLDLAYKICNDYDWCMRLHLIGGQGFYDGRLVYHFRVGGASTNGFRLTVEKLRILRSHGLLTARVAAPEVRALMYCAAAYVLKLVLPKAVRPHLKKVMRRIRQSMAE